MATKWIRHSVVAPLTALAVLAAGCGNLAQQGRAPVQLVILSLQAAPGFEPDAMGAVLHSDVLDRFEEDDVCFTTIVNDPGQVTMALVLKDQGVPGVTAEPSALNAVTITSYRVRYRRADGRNTPGVDVPFGFDGAVTFTVPADGNATSGLEVVRVIAKTEQPLAALVNNGNSSTVIADITFFGSDLAGNAVQTTGSIQIEFANWGDEC